MKRAAGASRELMPAAVAFALANLYWLFLTGPLVSPQHQLIFHLPGSATALFVPVVLDLLATTAVLFAALRFARRHPRVELLLYAALVLPLPLILVETCASFSGRPPNERLVSATMFCAGAALGFIVVRLRALVPRLRRIRRALQTIFVFLALSGIVLLAQLLWCGWQARHLNPHFPQRAIGSTDGPSSPRIVWVILDELSFREVYGHPPANLELPNFDRLASTGTVFTSASAPAQYTRIALPALLTGRPLAATSPFANGQTLSMSPASASHAIAFDPQDTLFADVAHAGLPASVAGWYEPYCRLLPGVLNHCFWTYSDDIPGGLSGDAPMRQNLIEPFRLAALNFLHAIGIGPGAPSKGAIDVRHHAADFYALSNAADDLLRSQDAGLIFLHMPIPHPWGFYDRHRNTFPPHRTSYLDNLALADIWLGHLRSTLEHDGSWGRTTVIIMGDHGWRTRVVWKDSGFWSAEDEQASHGATFPDAPAVIVKLPHQTSPSRVDTPFQTVRTRALIQAVITGSIQTPAQLAAWVAAPTSYAPNSPSSSSSR